MEAAPPPALPDELVEEIFLRLPPDEPAPLLRASLTSKAWGRTISSPAFRRRLHDFHKMPPVLGFLHDWRDGRSSHFIPTTASSFSLAVPDSRTWRAIDFRHGRALFISDDDQGAQEHLVWEPLTGTQRRVPVHPVFEILMVYGKEVYSCAAVFCAADGCDHSNCHGDPFGLVFIFINLSKPDTDEEFRISASVFSSETGTWGKLTSTHSVFPVDFSCYSSVLVGRSLYFMCDGDFILECDLKTHSMTVLYMPSYVGRYDIMPTKDGGLGVVEYSNLNLELWTRDASDGTDAVWVLSRVINLVNLLPTGALLDGDTRVEVLGFAEGTNIIFLNTDAGIFTVDLQSEKARKVCDRRGLGYLVPLVSFYTPVHQNLPSPTRVPSHGEVALECARKEYYVYALLYKAQAMNDPLDDVRMECARKEYVCALLDNDKEMNDRLNNFSKSASNEESVTGTTSKDGAGNSKTSGSYVEDATPSQNGESKEVLRG